MSWKSIVTTGLLCLIAAPVWAQPSLNVSSSYNSALDVIVWEISVTPRAGYTGAMSVEAPFTLSGDTAGFNPSLRSNSSTSQTTHSAGDNNGSVNETWYYNVDTNGTTRLWNAKNNAADLEQNLGANPFTGTNTEGLWLDTANNRLFAALGSDVNMPTPVKLLHIASHDGILSWSDLLIKDENGGSPAETLLNGSFSSIVKADMNADGVVNGLDVTPFVQALTNVPAYNAAFPGLDGIARADINNDGVANGLDVTPFVQCVTGGGCAPGGGSGGIAVTGGSVVPEPSAFMLIALCGISIVGMRVRI